MTDLVLLVVSFAMGFALGWCVKPDGKRLGRCNADLGKGRFCTHKPAPGSKWCGRHPNGERQPRRHRVVTTATAPAADAETGDPS